MPQSTHTRLNELHNIAEHTHDVGAHEKDKADHLTPHELTKEADERSRKEQERDEVLAGKSAKPNKA